MADPLERSPPASREISPIRQPFPPIKIKADDEEMSMITGAEADRSISVPTKEEDNESMLGDERERSASPSPSGVAEAADPTETEDISTADIQSKCVMSFLEPQPGKCGSKIINDDRHYISNFFGRNKSCSTSIPDDFYQVLCRKCMQSMKYRLKCNEEEKEVHSQVAAIKHVLQNMAASGKWVLMEVQLTKSEYDRRKDPKGYDEALKKFNDAVIKAREDAKKKGETMKRRNTKKPLIPVPDWLAELVVRNDDAEAGQKDYTVHDRQPTQWSFEDLIGLVDLIGENCDILPNIECLPVTQGELDQVQVKEAREYRLIALEECGKLLKDVANTKKALNEDPDDEQLQEELQDFQARLVAMEAEVQDAEVEIEKALKQAAASKHTIPPKRFHMHKPGKKGESSKRVDRKERKANATSTEGTKGRGSQETLIDSDAQNEIRAQTLPDPVVQNESRTQTLLEQEVPDPVSRSRSPPPGWKGKGKASAASSPKTPPPSQPEGKAQPKPRKSSPTKPPPSTPPPQTQEPALPDAAVKPSTPPPRTDPSTIPLPVTPNQPPSSSSPRTSATRSSTTRSAGRRMQLAAELELEQAQGQAQEQTQTHAVKREANDEEEEGGEQGAGAGGVTEQGSPARKRVKRE